MIYTAALNLLIKSSMKNNGTAHYYLGKLYNEEKGMSKDLGAAVECYKMAALSSSEEQKTLKGVEY